MQQMTGNPLRKNWSCSPDSNISVSSGPAIHVQNICWLILRYSGTHTLHRHHTSSNLLMREAQRRPVTGDTFHGRHPPPRHIGAFPADLISQENENCQARMCLKRRTLFTTHKRWLGASSKALSLQTPFIKGLSGVCLLLFTLPIWRRSPEPFQINQSNTPLWS